MIYHLSNDLSSICTLLRWKSSDFPLPSVVFAKLRCCKGAILALHKYKLKIIMVKFWCQQICKEATTTWRVQLVHWRLKKRKREGKKAYVCISSVNARINCQIKFLQYLIWLIIASDASLYFSSPFSFCSKNVLKKSYGPIISMEGGAPLHNLWIFWF